MKKISILLATFLLTSADLPYENDNLWICSCGEKTGALPTTRQSVVKAN